MRKLSHSNPHLDDVLNKRNKYLALGSTRPKANWTILKTVQDKLAKQAKDAGDSTSRHVEKVLIKYLAGEKP